MCLPETFVAATRSLMGDRVFDRYLDAIGDEPPVSIRVNPRLSLPVGVGKGQPRLSLPVGVGGSNDVVPWCRNAFYLSERPNFTFDPLLHAGCYYVQEASSMFLDTVLRQHLPDHPVMALDLCAAPGGKSTLLRTALPEGSVLISNEPVRQRASILLENVQKWGYDSHYVTNLYPRDIRKSGFCFDVILCDVPCSGEGMFRKDPATIGEWSPQNVEKCRLLQRDIVSDAWACLNDGGIMIYSTCTYNIKENEENIRWMITELGARVLSVSTEPQWNIVGSLLDGFHEPVYRFIPGTTRGEGLFMCVLRKGGSKAMLYSKKSIALLQANNSIAQGKAKLPVMERVALHTDGPRVELSYRQAIDYLRREALMLPPDTPRGIVEVTFMGYGLGTVKNLGTRANNLYPKEWRIKSTHVPEHYVPVLSI